MEQFVYQMRGKMPFAPHIMILKRKETCDNQFPNYHTMVEMKENIMVSVYCLAYNHEKYIRDTLDGFISQKTNFKFEVFVHDDASTDSTASIIKEYAELYPDIIKPIFQIENKYSKGFNIFIEYISPQMSGRYIAVCEGDDFWIDKYKLQKQFDALEKHPECDMCAHRANLYDCRLNKIVEQFPTIMEDKIISLEDTIYGEGGFLATASLFYRKEIKLDMMNFQKYWDLDYTIQIRGALRGGIVYLSDTMSTYRWYSEGSWTILNSSNDKQKSLFHKRQKMLDILDKETGEKYHSIIIKRMKKNEFDILMLQEKYKEAREYKDFWRKIPLITRVLLIYCPFLYNKLKKLKHHFIIFINN